MPPVFLVYANVKTRHHFSQASYKVWVLPAFGGQNPYFTRLRNAILQSIATDKQINRVRAKPEPYLGKRFRQQIS